MAWLVSACILLILAVAYAFERRGTHTGQLMPETWQILLAGAGGLVVGTVITMPRALSEENFAGVLVLPLVLAITGGVLLPINANRRTILLVIATLVIIAYLLRF